MEYTPDRAYRVSVVPFAIFLIIGGSIMFVLSFLVRVTSPFPFVESDAANRVIFIVLALMTIAFGVGLYLRSRIAWLGMLAYFALGTVAMTVGFVLDPRYGPPLVPVVFCLAVNVPFTVGIYFVTAPAFRRKDEGSGPKPDDHGGRGRADGDE